MNTYAHGAAVTIANQPLRASEHAALTTLEIVRFNGADDSLPAAHPDVYATLMNLRPVLLFVLLLAMVALSAEA